MKTVKCDRCGKDIPRFIPFLNAASGMIPTPVVMITVWNNNSQTLNEVDLCDDCKKAVYDYIFDFGNGVGA